ncbi:MAG: hypothetical protein V4696_01570 [Pseudomonadota bacterium]
MTDARNAELILNAKAELANVEAWIAAFENERQCYIDALEILEGPHQMKRRKKLLREMVRLDEEMGLYDDEAVPLSPNIPT